MRSWLVLSVAALFLVVGCGEEKAADTQQAQQAAVFEESKKVDEKTKATTEAHTASMEAVAKVADLEVKLAAARNEGQSVEAISGLEAQLESAKTDSLQKQQEAAALQEEALKEAETYSALPPVAAPAAPVSETEAPETAPTP